MSVQLQTWLEKLKKEVTEGSPMARRVRLCTVGDGTIWQSWEPLAELDAEAWAIEAEALLNALRAELPKRRVQLVFQAEDHGGATIANLVRSVTGENPQAQDLGTANGPKALADAFVSVQKLMDATLESARKWTTFQTEHNEKLQAQLSEYHELFMAIKKVELESDQQENATSKIMLEQVQSAAPLLMQAFEHWLSQQGKKSNGSAVAAVVNATNESKPS